MKKVKLSPRTVSGVFGRVTSFLGTFSLAYKLIEKNEENMTRIRVVGDMVNQLVECMDELALPGFNRAKREKAMSVCDQAELLLEQLESKDGDNQSA